VLINIHDIYMRWPSVINVVWPIAKKRLFTAQLVDSQLGHCSETCLDITIQLLQTEGYLTDELTKKKPETCPR